MQKKFEYKESRGLPGGPNEMFTYVTGVFDIYQAPSNIEGQGMFAGKPFKKGDLIGLAHSNGQPASQLGRMHNHDENSPTMISKKSGNDRFVFAAKDLQPGDELTTNYRMQPELEQPEDFQYGGSVMAPPRKGVRKNPDGSESTHLMATETFDGENWFSFPTLFQDPDGTWIDMSDRPWEEAYEEAKKRGEVIEFGTDKEAAIKFGEGSWKLPKAQKGNGEVISLSTSDPRYAEYYNRLNDDVVLADPSGKTAGRIFLDEVDVVADKATPPTFDFSGYTTTAVQDGIAQQTPFRFTPEGIAAGKSYQEYQDYIKSLPYDQRPGYIQPTISEYVPPSTGEWLWNKVTHPMSTLGYVVRGEDMPDMIGRENAIDYAVDVINPATYINTVGDIGENLSEGDIVGAGIDALTLTPIVPTAARQVKKAIPAVKNATKNIPAKINPRYYNPDMIAKGNSNIMYRQIGKDAYDDFVNSGFVRTKAEITDNPIIGLLETRKEIKDVLRLNKEYRPSQYRHPTDFRAPFFSRGKTTGIRDGGADYLIQTRPDKVTPDDFISAQWNIIHGNQPPVVGGFGIMDPMKRSAENFDVYKKSWWSGYKPVKQMGGSILPPAIRNMYPTEDTPIYGGIVGESTVTAPKYDGPQIRRMSETEMAPINSNFSFIGADKSGGLGSLRAIAKGVKGLLGLRGAADDVAKGFNYRKGYGNPYENFNLTDDLFSTPRLYPLTEEAAAKKQLANLKSFGKELDDLGFDANWIGPEHIRSHGKISGRDVVEVALPGNSQKSTYFYRSRKGGGYRPYPAHMEIYPGEDWFIKDPDIDNFYGSNSLRQISNMLDNRYQKGGEAAKIAAQQATGYRPQATISQYEEPAWYEKAADYLASPMTSLGYLLRGEDLPDRIPINAENRNAYDMAFDIINPAAWAAYAESADKNLQEGNYLAAGFDAMGAIPIIPSSVSQGRNVINVGAKSLPQYVKNVPVGNSDLLMTHAMPGLVPGIKGTKDGVLIAQAAGPRNNHMTLKKFLDAATGQEYYSFTESFIDNPMLAGRAFKMAEALVPKGSILKQAPGGTLSQDSFNLMTRRLGDTRRFRDLTNYDADYINLNEFAKGRNRLGQDNFTFSQSDFDALNAQYMDVFNNLGISEFRGLGSRQVPVMNLGNKGYNMFEIPGLQSIRDPRALQKYYNLSVPNITLQKLYQKGGEKTSWLDYANPFNWGVYTYDDAGTFGEAFAKARKEGQDQFMYYGDRYTTELAPTPEVKEEPKEEKLFYNKDILKGLSEEQAARRQSLLNAANAVASAQGDDDNLRRLLVMSAVMENTLGADPKAYGRDYTRSPMSIDDVAYNDLFNLREGARGYTAQQKKNAEWLEGLGINTSDVDSLLRADDPMASMAVARLVYGRAPEALPSGDDPDALYNYYLKYYNKGGVDKYGGAEAHRKKFNDYYNQIYREFGGETDQLKIYKDYVYGVYDGTEMQSKAEKIYDKLNRVYYKEAKQSGTTVPNYILSKVMKQSDN